MNREQRLNARREKLRGVDSRILRRAAAELDAVGKRNARIAEVDARSCVDVASQQDIYVIHEKRSDGSWRAYSVAEPVPGQGVLDVTRVDRENLEPALRWDLAIKLVRGAVFNEPRPAIECVRDQVAFRVSATMDEKVK